jgi:hypothetical protein
MTIEAREAPGTALKCPHCDAQLDELLVVRVRASLGRRYAYGCPWCRRLLSVTHRKGFWMG